MSPSTAKVRRSKRPSRRRPDGRVPLVRRSRAISWPTVAVWLRGRHFGGPYRSRHGVPVQGLHVWPTLAAGARRRGRQAS
eukprot:scaffold17609_cov50-Phaeocystis_antarctica.AAC.1